LAGDDAKDLRVRGIAAAKAGNRDEARRLLQSAIRLEPDNEVAWLWLASVARDVQERVFCLERLLQMNPNNESARKALAALKGEQEPAPAPAIRPIGGLKLQPPPPPAPAETSGPLPGVPLPDAETIAEAQRQAEAVVRTYMTTHEGTGAQWVHKTRNRAGERDIYVLRAQVAAAVVTILVLLGIGGTLFVLNNEDARAILFAPTPTMTFTPTMTPTSTPGLTPTPSPTPRLTLTPSPTVPPALPTYNPYAPPRPTDIYPRVESQPLRNAIGLVNIGQLEEALPTLAVERESIGELFNASPFYYEALALLKSGNEDAALRTLEQAESRLNASNTRQFRPVIDAGMARVYASMAADARSSGQNARFNEYSALAQEKAETAIEGDRLIVEPYLALSEMHRLDGALADALSVIDQALGVPELSADTRLIVARGELLYAQGDYDGAIYQTFLALTLNVATEPAHQLRVRAALAEDKPGLAVLYAQTYLFYYPGSTAAWALLGEARAQEGNRDLAIAAYTQALAGEEDDVAVTALLGRSALYAEQRRYDLALADLSRAYTLTDDPAIRRQRMEMAYRAGSTAIAQEDLDALRASADEDGDPALDLLQARLWVDAAGEADNATLQQAVGLLNGIAGLPDETMGIVREYTARAQLALGNLTAALNAVDAALTQSETVERRYLRGQILEAQRSTEAAIREYEWVLAWSRVYPLPFRLDVQERLEALTGE
jgi:tetratricopeptide (TPR) repeat protein